MSNYTMARRAAVRLYMNFADVTADLEPYFLSLTYTDSEDDETDDLQISLHDRGGLFTKKWFGDLIEASIGGIATGGSYTVTAPTGAAVRTGPDKINTQLGTLPYGVQIYDALPQGLWTKISYNGTDAYIPTNAITKNSALQRGAMTAPLTALPKEGDTVTVTGTPQQSPYGGGAMGEKVTSYRGSVTGLSRSAPFPVCVSHLGWFALADLGIGTGGGNRASGMTLQAVIVSKNRDTDGKDRMLDCGSFELDSLKISGPPNVVTIKGTSLPYSSTVRKVAKTRSWENYNLSGIVEEISRKNGMACLYLPGAAPYYSRVEQDGISDIDFLKRLCDNAGYALKATNNILVIFDRYAASDRRTVLTITPDTPYEKMSISTGKNTKYTCCRVSCVASSGQVIEGWAYNDDYKEPDDDDEDYDGSEILEITQRVSSVAEAERIAEAQLKKCNQYALKLQFTFYGDTTLLAGQGVTLKGWGALDGEYVISAAKHSVGSSYTTQIDLRKAEYKNG